jgi:hypothetical protein
VKAVHLYLRDEVVFDKYSIMLHYTRPSLKDKNGKTAIQRSLNNNSRLKAGFLFALATVGVPKIFNHQREPAVARAVAFASIPHTLSTTASTRIENIAEAHGPDATRRFQLYWPANENNEIRDSLLSRAKKNGYSALIVTRDTYILGAGDLATWIMGAILSSFIHAGRIRVEIRLSDPVFRGKFRWKHGYDTGEAEKHRG